MWPNREARGRSRRFRAGMVALALLATSRAGSGGPEADLGPGEALAVGRLVSIEVEGGRARFRVPTPSPGSKALLVVSALAREGGPFPIRVEAAPTEPGPIGLRHAPALGGRSPAPPRPGDVPPPALGIPPASRAFSMLVRDGDPASAGNYRRINARLRAVGNWVQVYVDDRDVARVAPETLRDVVETFDREVLPAAARRFGPARDVDGDGRFTVLFSRSVAPASGPGNSVDGCVRGADFDPSLPPPFGNRADVLYLDAGLRAGPYLRTVLAHEYTHAVTFSRKLDAPRPPGAPPGDEEGWIEEGTAHLVEDLHGFSRANLDYRVSAFLSAPERYSLVVKDYYADDLFRSHGHRGSTYLFLRWCADRFGPGFLPALVGSPRGGVENLESAAGVGFEELYRRWSASLFLDALLAGDAPADDRWLLAGPRVSVLEPGGPADLWSSEATASHFALIEPSPTGAVAIEVQAPPEARLQVTLVRLPDDLPRLDLDVRLVRDSDGTYRAEVTLDERDGRPVRLESLGWEPLVPTRGPMDSGFRRGSLRGDSLRDAFAGLDLAAGGRIVAGSVPLPGVSPAEGRLVFKAVGVDRRGRRVAGWAEAEPGREAEVLSETP